MPPRPLSTPLVPCFQVSRQPYVCQSCRSKLLPSKATLVKPQWRAFALRAWRPEPQAQKSRGALYGALYTKQYSHRPLQPSTSICPARALSRPLSSACLKPSSSPRSTNAAQLCAPYLARSITTTPDVKDINAEIPYNAGKLHKALSALEQDASIFVDISQLRLVLRSLESKNPVTRVAILGVEDQAGARRLAHVLLADPLEEEKEWERMLLDLEGDGRALLLRYGEHAYIDARNPLTRIMFLPAGLLQKYDLEIFVHAVPSQALRLEDGTTNLLIPGLDIAGSSLGGHMSTVTYPVHKSLVYTNGLAYASSLALLTQQSAPQEQQHLVKGTVDGAWTNLDAGSGSSTFIDPINLSLSSEAISRFRASVSESLAYSSSWTSSNLPTISTWITQNTTSSTSLKPSLIHLIHALLNSTTASISTSSSLAMRDARRSTITASTRQILSQAITTWSRRAHSELLTRLTVAFTSRSWRQLSWHLLLFRADDIAPNLTSLLTHAFLPDADRASIYLSGRLTQSGLLGEPKLLTPTAEDRANQKVMEEVKRDTPSYSTPQQDMADLMLPPAFDQPGGTAPLDTPTWNPLIDATRASLIRDTIPKLQWLAQREVMKAASLSFFSASVAGIAYVGIEAVDAYGAGAVAAVGTVWALRRLQRTWELARQKWREMVREEGVKVLRECEGGMRAIVEEGGFVREDELGVEEREKAKRAVERCLGELKAVEGMDQGS